MAKPDEVLSAFGQSLRALIELLHEDPRLEIVEQMFIESNLSLLRSAFDGWKLRNSQK